jgi:hypothetical protein
MADILNLSLYQKSGMTYNTFPFIISSNTFSEQLLNSHQISKTFQINFSMNDFIYSTKLSNNNSFSELPSISST